MCDESEVGEKQALMTEENGLEIESSEAEKLDFPWALINCIKQLLALVKSNDNALRRCYVYMAIRLFIASISISCIVVGAMSDGGGRRFVDIFLLFKVH